MPEKKVACFCGIWCAAPRTVSATTRRKHCKVVEEVGGVVMPPYEPGTGSVNEESWKRHALENSRMYAASRAKGSAQKRRADDHGAAKKHPRTDAPSTMQTASPEASQSMHISSSEGVSRMPSPPVNPSSPAISESLRGNYEPDIGTPETDEPSEPGRPLSPDPDYLPSEDTGMPDVLHIETLQTAQKFIDELRNSTLEDTGLSDKAIHRLRNPPRAPPIDLSNDESLRQSLDLWVTLSKAAENVYDSVNTSIHRNMGVEVLSKDSLERKINEMTGLYPQRDDMCIDTCAAFTGPFANDDICPVCKKARYDEVIDSDGKRTNKPRKQFLTNPIGPLIQAAWASKESAREMSYRKNATPAVVEEYHARNGSVESLTDWIHGSDYIEAVNRGHIDADTTTLTLSLDGAQLYHNKQSDCWIYIWILMDRSPESRYKKPHMVVGGIIPGPNKPKNVDSFLFPGFQHVAALMKEGLTIWDASQDRVFRSKVFLAYVTADGPGMQFVNGLVGHSGRYGCRLYCPVRGRRKKNSGHYYPALLKPDPPYDISGCTHDDIDPYDVPRRPQDEAAARYRRNLIQVASATNTTRYEKERLETGIAKMSLVSGLPADCILGIPNCFPPDIMHLSALNIPDLLISLWRATLTCEEPDNKDTWDWAIFRDADAWKAHGLAVSAASLLLPGSFDRLPRNIAEKLTSGYKAVEFLTYMYGLAPALLYGVLPEKYWRHHCKLVRGIRLVYQRQVTKDQIIEAHQLLTEYEEEFEKLYYQRASTRIHFVRQSIHALLHIGPGTFQFGPYSIFSQFPLERIIGDLGRDIRQDSNPYANLAMIAERRCMLNALIHIYPQFMPPPPLFPQYSTPLGDGYALLRKRERFPSAVASDAEAVALRQFFATSEDIRASNEWLAKPSIARWARLRLPCGQTARSRWKDGRSTLMNPPRPSRHIKFMHKGVSAFAEVLYYFKFNVGEGNDRQPRGYAMVSLYGAPNATLLKKSYQTVYSCSHLGDAGLLVIEAKSIQAVIAAIPHSVVPDISDPEIRAELQDKVFIVEKLGMDVMILADAVNNGEDDDELDEEEI